MAEQKTPVAAQADTIREVDRIRDIIFGTQMRDYDQRFQVVQRDLDRLQQELDRLSQQCTGQDEEQGKKLQNARQETRQAISDLREELRQTAQQLRIDKTDRVALGDLLIELGNQLKTGGTYAELLKGLEQPK